jgi:hypothetical protein
MSKPAEQEVLQAQRQTSSITIVLLTEERPARGEKDAPLWEKQYPSGPI